MCWSSGPDCDPCGCFAGKYREAGLRANFHLKCQLSVDVLIGCSVRENKVQPHLESSGVGRGPWVAIVAGE